MRVTQVPYARIARNLLIASVLCLSVDAQLGLPGVMLGLIWITAPSGNSGGPMGNSIDPGGV
ncbi:MAG: hypothetical protein ACI8QC_003887 [Planctomycetota bacterium]|jgi:hypothetical protein